MQILLLKDVQGLGQAGDVKNVAAGYAQNFLIPRSLAVPASAGAMKQAQALRESAARQRQREADAAKEQAARLNGQVVTFTARAGENDRLYGSINSHDVAEALARSTGVEIDHRHVELEHPIKDLGEHDVPVKLGTGAVAMVKVVVERALEVE